MNLVAEACNGHEAIVEFRTHRPDITLMDLQMPKMDGVDAYDRDSPRISGRADHRRTTFASEVEIRNGRSRLELAPTF